MIGETYHLIDREVIMNRIKTLEPASPERMFLLSLLDNSIRIHKPQHNYHIDKVIEVCEERGDYSIKPLLQKCKI